MWTMKKFLYCLELESGARLIAAYCALTNVAYIIALFSIYQHMDVKKVSENLCCWDYISYDKWIVWDIE